MKLNHHSTVYWDFLNEFMHPKHLAAAAALWGDLWDFPVPGACGTGLSTWGRWPRPI